MKDAEKLTTAISQDEINMLRDYSFFYEAIVDLASEGKSFSSDQLLALMAPATREFKRLVGQIDERFPEEQGGAA